MPYDDEFDWQSRSAPGNPNNTPGSVNVLYGSATGLQASSIGGPDDQLWTRNSPSVKGDQTLSQYFGAALAAGDFNHDGFDDLCIGAPWDGGSDTINGPGSVNCLYGSAPGLQGTGVGGPDDQLWTQDIAGVIGVVEDGDDFGWALASGDFDGDGFYDLAVGVPGENAQGGINVLYGSKSGLQAMGTGGPANQFWNQDSPGVPGSGGGSFGVALGR